MSDEEESTSDPNAWLATFGDLITLLMTFFVLMLSFSALNTEKFEAALDAFDNVFGLSAREKLLQSDGVLEMVNPQALTRVMGGGETPAYLDPMENVYEEIIEYMTQSKYAQFLEMKKTKQGFIITIDSAAFFEKGGARFKSEDIAILDKLVGLVRLFPNNLSIKGHVGKSFSPTDKFESGMDLSIARAVNTCKYFLNQGISPERLGVAGYGSYSPLSHSELKTGKVSSDRIEIAILNVQ